MEQTRFAENLAGFEDDLRLPRGFLFKLLGERDDWSFVVKTGALLEAAVVHVLSDQDVRLRPVFKRMNWPSRLKCLKSFGLLDQRAYAFIDAFVWLRNQCAHNIEHVNSSILDILSSDGSPGERAARMRKLALLARGEPVMLADEEVSIEDRFQKEPRLEVLIGLSMVLAAAYDHVRFSREMVPSIFRQLVNTPDSPEGVTARDQSVNAPTIP